MIIGEELKHRSIKCFVKCQTRGLLNRQEQLHLGSCQVSCLSREIKQNKSEKEKTKQNQTKKNNWST